MNPNPERDERVRNPPCPFCKWTEIGTAYWNSGAWRVLCAGCNAEGPNALSELAANEAWSKSADAAIRMRDACVVKVRIRRDKFQAAADASSLPNDLTASRDAATAAALTRLLDELESLTLEQGEQEKSKS